MFVQKDKINDQQGPRPMHRTYAVSALALGAALLGGIGLSIFPGCTGADVITQPSLLYVGNTFCPDVCPLDNARNAVAVEILEGRGRMVNPVFISIDPARDTPEEMANSLACFIDAASCPRLAIASPRAN